MEYIYLFDNVLDFILVIYLEKIVWKKEFENKSNVCLDFKRILLIQINVCKNSIRW